MLTEVTVTVVPHRASYVFAGVLSPLFTPVRSCKPAGSQGFLHSKELYLAYLLLALYLISLKVFDALVKIPFMSVTYFLYYVI